MSEDGAAPRTSTRVPRPIRRVLVANRGEIARRILRTCRRMGIATVAVFSTADARAPFVAEADVAVAIGGPAPADSYLRVDAIVDAARRTGADAVHPGYGFLAEDPAFARAVLDAGLTWIGPAPEVMAEMGSKLAARERMAAAGVPVLPGGRVLPPDGRLGDEAPVEPDGPADPGASSGPGASTDLDALAREVGLPLLVKASAGGGGRGMRRVTEHAQLADAVRDATREARAAFGEGTVFLERLVSRPRHVEVQILGDRHGTVSVLPERDCSLQRRHQKLVEESPAPAIGPDVRRRLADAARAAGQALGYVGAGTVEFVLSPEGEVYFLEVNARLQVEHPVTELVCGLDLVELQLRVAEGEALPAEAVDPPARGHAIEARLVAEDPVTGWRPQTGLVERFHVPGAAPGPWPGTVADRLGQERSPATVAGPNPPALGRAGAGVTTTLRLDSAVEDGTEISPHYDSMVAKVLAHAPDRPAAVRALASALRRAELAGPPTARDLLVRALEGEAFAAVAHHTQLLDGEALADLARPLLQGDEVALRAAAAALVLAARRRAHAPVLADLPSGWRNVGRQPQEVVFDLPAADDEGDGLVVRYRLDRHGQAALLEVDGRPLDGPRIAEVTLAGGEPGSDAIALEVDGVRRPLRVRVGRAAVWVGDEQGELRLHVRPRFVDPAQLAAAGSFTAPLPGAVLRVLVAPGDAVVGGQALVVLEAMKMEHEVAAAGPGTVGEVLVAAGDQVSAGQALVVVEAGG